MKLSTIDDNIRSLGLGQGNDFKINASAKAFDILSSNIYQNKILAVIREITCNAVDAHKMVGKDASTIEVHIPNHLQPFFSVRDYGPGLSHDNVMSLYTTYFLSTKDTSDDFIGGLGLGSKSPFAVADQFTVVSRYQGVCSTYIMYRDAGQPKINVVSQVSDNEPSGLLVSVAINKDYGAWETEAHNLFRWWRVRPKTGLTFTNIDDAMGLKATDTLDGFPVWFFTKSQNSINGPSVLMGGVRYAVTFSNVLGLKTQMSASTPLVMVFPIGAVDISTSRETLSYTPKTCAAIIQRLTEITNNFRAIIQTNIDGCATLYAARDLLWNSNENLSGLFQQLGGNTTSILWKGKAIHQRVHLSWEELRGAASDATFRTYSMKGWQNRKYQLYGSSDTIPTNAPPHVILDNSVGRYGRNYPVFWLPTIDRKLEYKFKYNLQHHAKATDTAMLILSSDFKVICDYFESVGLPLPIDASGWPDIPPTVKTAAAANRSPPTKGYIINPQTLAYEATEKDIDLKGGGVYIPFFGGDPEYPLNDLRLLINMEHKFPNIIGLRRLSVTQKLQAELDKNGWIANNRELISKVISDTTLSNHYEKVTFYNTLNSNFNIQMFNHILMSYKGTQPLPTILTTLQAKAYDFYKMPLLHSNFNPTQLTDVQQAVVTAAINNGNKLAADFKAFLLTKPLLRHLNYNQTLSPVDVINYIVS